MDLCLFSIGFHEWFKLHFLSVCLIFSGAEQSVSPGCNPGSSHLVEHHIVEIGSRGIVFLIPYRVFDAINEETVSLGSNPGFALCVYAVAIYAGFGLQHQGALLGLSIKEICLVVAGTDGEFIWCHLADVSNGVAPFLLAVWFHLNKLGAQFFLLYTAEHAVACAHPNTIASIYKNIEQKVGMEEGIVVLNGEMLQGIVFRVIYEETTTV